jgi:long-chain acyl-CoA synthetase
VKNYTELKDQGGKPNLWLKLNKILAHFLVYRKIKDMFGGNIRFLISGAAPISPNIIRYFHWIGLDIYEGYGLTETTGIVTGNKMGKAKIGSVGQALADTEIRIAEDGEICTRCPQNISGYYNNEEATNELLIPDEKGDIWLHTGDIGYLDEEGYLFITDRKKDIIITAGGKNVAPQNIENLLKTSPYISLAMVYGDKKPYLTALVTLDDDEIAKFARDKKIMYQDLADLSKKQEVLDLLHHEISGLNRDLASYETVKKFRILEEELDQDKDEVTPTLKVKRKVVIEHYQDLIKEMYA